MNPVTSSRKIYNTMAVPLERGIQRLLSKYLPAYFKGMGHDDIADACLSIASAHTVPDMADAIRLASLCEPLHLQAMTPREAAEQIEKNGGEVSREKLIELAGAEQMVDLLGATSRMVLSNFAFMHMGMYTSSIKGSRAVLDFVLEVTVLAKLRELQGGYCPCGCTYPEGDEAFTPIKGHISAAVEIERATQITDILEAISRSNANEVIPDPNEALPGKLPDHRRREDNPQMPMDLASLMSMLAFAVGKETPTSAPAATEEVPADDSAG